MTSARVVSVIVPGAGRVGACRRGLDVSEGEVSDRMLAHCSDDKCYRRRARGSARAASRSERNEQPRPDTVPRFNNLHKSFQVFSYVYVYTCTRTRTCTLYAKVLKYKVLSYFRTFVLSYESTFVRKYFRTFEGTVRVALVYLRTLYFRITFVALLSYENTSVQTINMYCTTVHVQNY